MKPTAKPLTRLTAKPVRRLAVLADVHGNGETQTADSQFAHQAVMVYN